MFVVCFVYFVDMFGGQDQVLGLEAAIRCLWAMLFLADGHAI